MNDDLRPRFEPNDPRLLDTLQELFDLSVRKFDSDERGTAEEKGSAFIGAVSNELAEWYQRAKAAGADDGATSYEELLVEHAKEDRLLSLFFEWEDAKAARLCRIAQAHFLLDRFTFTFGS